MNWFCKHKEKELLLQYYDSIGSSSGLGNYVRAFRAYKCKKCNKIIIKKVAEYFCFMTELEKSATSSLQKLGYISGDIARLDQKYDEIFE
jgi:hypothetical protein